jgi:hypothetical protein
MVVLGRKGGEEGCGVEVWVDDFGCLVCEKFPAVKGGNADES